MAPRAVLPAPTELRGLPSDVRVEAGEIPTLQQLGLEPVLSGKAAPADGPLQCGGEEEALRQLHRFLAQAAPNDGAGVAAGSAFGCNFASCIAPWLAISCLSPRRLLEEAQRVLGGAGQAGPAAAAAQTPLERVQFELLWRDFFRWAAWEGAARMECWAVPKPAMQFLLLLPAPGSWR